MENAFKKRVKVNFYSKLERTQCFFILNISLILYKKKWDLQTTITSLRELNTKYAELETKNIEVNVENAKLKQTLKDYEARFANIEHKDEEKAIHIAKLDDEIKEIKQSSTNTSSIENFDNIPEQCQPIRTETKLLEDKETDDFLDGTYRKSVSNRIRQHNKEKKLQDSETFVASWNTTTRSNLNLNLIKYLIQIFEDQIKLWNPNHHSLGWKKWTGVDSRMSLSMSSLKEKIQEVSNHATKISETMQSQKSDISLLHGTSMIEISQHLAQLCNKALIAKECTLEANQEEIFCWYHYRRNFVLQDKALCYK
ncbi:hypothetical protein F8M41_012989 [Gigaspora margarita]|uniref:Uncharacterized protein n=1 Tax=Gigaspora margarita TaxID=4874 RepID=A0A8H3WZ67_GIGMA|nr:hypothetical protein F8M41_012989 [Gigaspora margarita]